MSEKRPPDISATSRLEQWPPQVGAKIRCTFKIGPATLYHVRGSVDGRVAARYYDGYRWRLELFEVYWFAARGMLAEGVFESALEQCAQADREVR